MTPEDYGATGDGHTDDTTALQAAIDAGGPVELAARTYRHTGLTLRNGTHLTGAGSGTYGTTAPQRHRSTLKLMDTCRDVTALRGPPGVAAVVLQDIDLDGSATGGAAGTGIALDDSTGEEAHWKIHRCFVHEFTGDGLTIGAKRRAVKVTLSTFHRNGGNGITIRGSDAGIRDCVIGSNTGDGIHVATSITRIDGCDIYGNTNGIATPDGGINQLTVQGCGVDRNRRHGVSLGKWTWGVTLVGNLFHSNSGEQPGRWNHIDGPQAREVTVVGNVFGVDAGLGPAGACVNGPHITDVANVAHPGAALP